MAGFVREQMRGARRNQAYFSCITAIRQDLPLIDGDQHNSSQHEAKRQKHAQVENETKNNDLLERNKETGLFYKYHLYNSYKKQ